MVNISPEQAVFTAVRQACVLTGYNTYDYLPREVDYPFIFVAEQFGNDIIDNKEDRTKAVQQTVHIYHNDYKKRGTTSNIMETIYQNVLSLERIGGRRFFMTKNQQVIPDSTTSIPLQHGILEFEFELN